MSMKTNLDIVAEKILSLLNENCKNLVSKNSLSSTRAIGDAVQEYLANKGLTAALNNTNIAHIENDFTRRSMEDMAFADKDGNYYAVDAKTHNLSTHFNMPNLISVQRLAKFYKNNQNTFCVLIVAYAIENDQLEYKECYFKPIEAFSWDCLTLGALGWGQIQIANANRLIFNQTIDRKKWMLELCDRLSEFYDAEIGKIGERKAWFADIRKYWEQQ